MSTGLARYKDLCIDATDAGVSARFWAAQLDLVPTQVRSDTWRLADGAGRAVVWVNEVPEPLTGKNRLHLDVNAASLRTALDAGATVLDDTLPWTLMQDPEGQQLCVFVREQPVTRRFYELVWDTGDSAAACHRTAAWWVEVLGGRLVDAGGGEERYVAIEEVPGAPFEYLVFQPVPEPKTVKNRVHVDVDARDLEALLAHGARVLREKDGDIGWHVLADPEGNEFCAFLDD